MLAEAAAPSYMHKNKTKFEITANYKGIGSGGGSVRVGGQVFSYFHVLGLGLLFVVFIIIQFVVYPCAFFAGSLFVFIITAYSIFFFRFYRVSSIPLLFPAPSHTRSGPLLHGPIGFASNSSSCTSSMEDQGLAAGVRSKRFGVQLFFVYLRSGLLCLHWVVVFCCDIR